MFNSQGTEKQTHLSECGEHTALIRVTKMTPQSSLAPSSQIISSFQLLKKECLQLGFKHILNTHTHTRTQRRHHNTDRSVQAFLPRSLL